MKVNYLVAILLFVGLNLELGANWVEAYSWTTQTSYVLGNYDMPLQLTNHELYQKLARVTGRPESELIILEHTKDEKYYSGKLPRIGSEVLNNDVLVSPDLFFEKEGNAKEKKRYVFFFEFVGQRMERAIAELEGKAILEGRIANSKIYSRNITIKKPGEYEFIDIVVHSEPGKQITGKDLYEAVKDRTGEAVDDFYLFTDYSVIPNDYFKLDEFDEIIDMVFTEKRQSSLLESDQTVAASSLGLEQDASAAMIHERNVTIQIPSKFRTKVPGNKEFIDLVLHSKPGRPVTHEDLYVAVKNLTGMPSLDDFWLEDFDDNEIPNDDSELEEIAGAITMYEALRFEGY